MGHDLGRLLMNTGLFPYRAAGVRRSLTLAFLAGCPTVVPTIAVLAMSAPVTVGVAYVGRP
jgi:hypothetical protein